MNIWTVTFTRFAPGASCHMVENILHGAAVWQSTGLLSICLLATLTFMSMKQQHELLLDQLALVWVSCRLSLTCSPWRWLTRLKQVVKHLINKAIHSVETHSLESTQQRTIFILTIHTKPFTTKWLLLPSAPPSKSPQESILGLSHPVSCKDEAHHQNSSSSHKLDHSSGHNTTANTTMLKTEVTTKHISTITFYLTTTDTSINFLQKNHQTMQCENSVEANKYIKKW